MNTNCIICFSDFLGKKYRCTDTRCTEAMCNDCMIRYIEISYGENRNLVCPRDSCIGVYDKKSLEFLDREYFDKYKILIYNHYKSSKNTEIEKIKKGKEIKEGKEVKEGEEIEEVKKVGDLTCQRYR